MQSISSYIDHTNLKAGASIDDINMLCQEAKDYSFKAVCVNGVYVSQASELLKQTDVLVASVVGFPLGANTAAAKSMEAAEAISSGADEIDMVIHLPFLMEGHLLHLESEIKAVKKACKDKVLKVIIETCYLSNQHIVDACKVVINSGAEYIKTSTGFGSAGAQLEHVQLMKKTVGNQIQIKASGGIRTLESSLSFIDAGADRLGMSAGVKVMEEFYKES